MTQTKSQRDLAVAYFNAAWALIDDPARSAEQERQMLVLACASRQLWGEIGGPTEVVTGDWQIAHVAALTGHDDLSLEFANAAYELAIESDVPLWLVASTCEGLARAHAAAGHQAERDAWIAKAREHLVEVDDKEDRELIESQIASIPNA
jgi:hypothetical protein